MAHLPSFHFPINYLSDSSLLPINYIEYASCDQNESNQNSLKLKSFKFHIPSTRNKLEFIFNNNWEPKAETATINFIVPKQHRQHLTILPHI